MVSGFLISPNDQLRIFSGLASVIWIWSNVSGFAAGLKKFISSWFINQSFYLVAAVRQESRGAAA